MRAKLTKSLVERILPEGKPVIVHDTEIRGFHLKVSPTGQRSYFLYYRTGDHTERRPKIGDHGPLTCDNAREIAQRWLFEALQGKDPSAARHKARGASTVAELMDRYLREHVAAHNKPSTQDEAKRLVESRIKPVLGPRKVPSITRQDIKALHQALHKTPYEANRVLAALSKAFALATDDWGLRPDNPCKGIKRFPERKRERFLSDEELAAVGAVLNDAEEKLGLHSNTVLAIRLLALTGCRLGEVCNLRWEYFDREQGVLMLPDAKTGARTVSLGKPVTDMLKARRQESGWLLTRQTSDGPISLNMVEKGWRLIREVAKVPDARLHDLRHTVGTYAAQTGANAFLVRDLLGHKTLSMTGRYVERSAKPVQILATRVANRIEKALAGEVAKVAKMGGMR